MLGQSRKADSATVSLLLGLFLLWNWRLASVTAFNHQFVERAQLVNLGAWSTVFFAGLVLSLYGLFRNMQQTLIGVCCFVIFWLLGGRLVSALLAGDMLSMMMQLVMIVSLSFVARYAIDKNPDLAGRVAVVFGAVVFAMQAPGLYKVLTTKSFERPLNGFESDLPSTIKDSLPHIIYIVPDRYASNANLYAMYDYSNQPFTSQIQARGFHVWDNQYANYPKTFISLASTLNADYLDPLIERIPEKATSYSYLNPLIRDFAAQRALRERGYFYTHIGAWWAPTKTNPYADQNYKDETLPFDELTKAYLQFTPLVFLLTQAEAQKTACEIIDDKVELIHQKVQSDTPQFILWHTLLTHDPYIYEDDGSCRDPGEERYFIADYDARQRAYLKQIEHFNRITLDLIDSSFRDASRDVIFVIQSDEGPFPESLVRASYGLSQSPYNYLEAPRGEMNRKHGIFNAIHLPSQDYEDVHDLRSPVNNFRLIFRELTGRPVPLLADRSYSFEFDHHPYDLEDISQELGLNDQNVSERQDVPLPF